MRTFLLLLVCLQCVFFVESVSAQDAGSSVNIDRQALIQREIELQKARLNSSSSEERLNAVLRLGWLKDVEASRAATIALRDSETLVRVAAINAIQSLPSNESINYLLPLLDDKTEIIRQETAYALGKSQNQNAVSKLLYLFNNKKEKPGVKGAVAFALGQIGDKSAVPALVQALQEKKKPNALVQSAAARSLGLLKANEATQLLISILSDEKAEADVRREAAFALGEIRDASAVSALNLAAKSNDPYLAKTASESLKAINTKTIQ